MAFYIYTVVSNDQKWSEMVKNGLERVGLFRIGVGKTFPLWNEQQIHVQKWL